LKAILVAKKILSVLVLLCGFIISSCNEPENIGLEVQPEKDKFNVFFNDSTVITAYTVKEDTIRTDKMVYNLLGNYNDPIFGRTSASFYTQVRLSSNNVDFGPSPQPDSLVLTFAYKGYYGKLRKVNVKVHELLDNIFKDTAYYSNQNFNISSQTLASTTIIPNPNDSISIDGQKLPPHLRIKLDNTLAQKFLNESASSNLSGNDNFLDFFKGLFITTDFVNSEGSVLYFDLLSSLSQLTLYYKNDNNDSLKYNFVINDNCARFNTYAHYDYNNAAFTLQQQINGDTLLGDSLLYLQSMAGLKVKIQFNELKHFLQSNYLVLNKAELIIPVENDNSQLNYKLPEKLTLARITETGELTYLIDQFEGESHFRGQYDQANHQYSFTITRHIQNIILENIDDFGMYLMISGSGINAGRAVLRGNGRSENNFKLKLTYTKL